MGTEDDEVIRFFDDQMLGGVPLRELMRAVATLVDGVVGVQLPDGSTYQAGRTAADVPELRTSLPRGGECWIRTAHGCRELILQRLRVAVPLAVKATELTEAPLRTLLREGGATAAGARALDALGVSPSTSIYAVWLNGESTDRQVLVNHLEALGNQILGRIDDSATTVLAVYAADQEFKVERVPLGIRAAYTGPGALGHADQQWQTLSVAARFALPAARTNGPFAVLDGVFFNGNLGAFSLLGDIDRDDIARNPDVVAISRIVAEEGSDVLRILEAYAVTRSMRKASEMLFVHYNTVAYWVHKTEHFLGYATSEPYRQAQLFLALCLYRLSTSGAFEAYVP